MKRYWILAAALLVTSRWSAAETETIRLWPGEPPLAVTNPQPEKELPLDKGMDPDIVRLGNVSEPSMTVYHPPAGQRNGTCVLICPGGGYSILAMKHEGSQVAEWLNTLGVTAVVLKYRVPVPKGEPAVVRPLLDAQRAMSLIRSRAGAWGINKDRVGILGFSAGGNLAAWVLCEGNRRAPEYPQGETSERCRPDFGILIYPAYMVGAGAGKAPPTIHLDAKPGPTFLVMAADDPLGPENVISFFEALRKAEVPAALHVFQKGGHGFGMLPNGLPVNHWPALCADWMRLNKLIE